jgi:hypothetical protein
MTSLRARHNRRLKKETSRNYKTFKSSTIAKMSMMRSLTPNLNLNKDSKSIRFRSHLRSKRRQNQIKKSRRPLKTKFKLPL